MRLLPYAPFLPFALSLVLLLANACANPVRPTGGPRDDTPPAIEASRPAVEEVNVSTDTEAIRITFSEYVDQASLARAVSLTPAFERPLEFEWDGRAVAIELPEALRDTTTYILTIDTDLQDEREGVELRQPITLAFSTGPRINRGRLAGRVIGAARGQGIGGLDVYAYPAPDTAALDSLPPSPAYRTQTNPQGTFRFAYLREQPYYVVALADRDRNRQPDPSETFAVPPRPALRADSAQADSTQQWVATSLDRVPPTLNRAQALSQSRLVLRFSEAVQLPERAPAMWTLRDSLAGTTPPVRAVYQRPDEPLAVYLRTAPLRADAPHVLRAAAGATRDSAGNALPAARAAFTPSEQPDTAQTRIVGFVPEDLRRGEQDFFLLPPGTQPGIQLSQPADNARLRAALTVQDTTGQAQPFALETTNGTTVRLAFDPPLAPGEAATVRLDPQLLDAAVPDAAPDTVYARRFRRLSSRDLGELSGAVAVAADTATADTAAAPVVVELYEEGEATPLHRTTLGPDGRFLFERLPEASYRFRAFLDQNENGRWDGGQIAPYAPAEPITWSRRSVQTRARWETTLEDTLRVAAPPA